MTPSSSQNMRGIVLMILAMSAFAIADGFIKLTATSLSSAQTLLFLVGGSLIVFSVMAKWQGHTLFNRAAVSPLLLTRYVAEIAGTLGMVQALRYVPLSTVGAILQATPLVVVAGAVLVLRERVSWRRWSAIAVGFVGVLMIIRPGTQSFDASILWAVLAMVGLAARDLTTRVTPVEIPSASLAAYTMAAGMPLVLLWLMINEDPLVPTEVNVWWVLGMIGFATSGYLLIINSIRIAEVSVVSPYRYTRLVFLMLIGVLIFDETLDTLTVLGAAVIVLSGLYTMWRERQHGSYPADQRHSSDE